LTRHRRFFSLLARARAIWHEQGPLLFGRRTLAFAWRRSLRHLMPTRRSFYWSGVRVLEDRVLDDWLLPDRYPRQPIDIPNYEEALVEGLHRLVRPGDQVVVVGGGFGVTSVLAAQAAGVSGRVWCYEASVAQLSWIRTTVALNRKSRPMAPVHLVHAYVGRARPAVVDASDVDASDVEVIEPSALPACDVLELDCEGSELGILEGMTIRPRVLVVETHGVFGAPTPAVRKLIESRGYSVLSIRLAEERLHDLHVAQDVQVIVAVRA